MTKANYFNANSRFKGISASALKITAIAAMLADHISVVFLGPQTTILRDIGRIAFPIFAYFIGEGARRTKSPLKYFLRLLAFALISEIPFDLAFNGSILEFSSQNVFFTLLAGLASIETFLWLKKNNCRLLSVISTALFSAAAMYAETDYGAMGVVLITALFIFSEKRTSIKFAGSAFFILLLTIIIKGLSLSRLYIAPGEIWAVFAVIPLMLYNGEKGTGVNKFFFYGFYPLHLLILAFISAVMGRP